MAQKLRKAIKMLDGRQRQQFAKFFTKNIFGEQVPGAKKALEKYWNNAYSALGELAHLDQMHRIELDNFANKRNGTVVAAGEAAGHFDKNCRSMCISWMLFDIEQRYPDEDRWIMEVIDIYKKAGQIAPEYKAEAEGRSNAIFHIYRNLEKISLLEPNLYAWGI